MLNGCRKLRNCDVCNVRFYPQFPHTRYCSDSCRESLKEFKRISKLSNWDRSPRPCRQCNKEFCPNCPTHYCCSIACSVAYSKSQYIAAVPFVVSKECPVCNIEFTVTGPNRQRQKFCSAKCRRLQGQIEYERLRLVARSKIATAPKRAHHQKATVKPQAMAQPKIISTAKPTPKGVCDDMYSIYFGTEKDFHYWFDRSYVMFGLCKLNKSGVSFPDVTATTCNGDRLRIELEYHANNFRRHLHDPNMCDLVIAYVKDFGQTHVKGVPVFAIFDVRGHVGNSASFDWTSRKLTAEFEKLCRLQSCTLDLIVATKKPLLPSEMRFPEAEVTL